MIYWYVKKYEDLFIHKTAKLEELNREDQVSSAIRQVDGSELPQLRDSFQRRRQESVLISQQETNHV